MLIIAGILCLAALGRLCAILRPTLWSPVYVLTAFYLFTFVVGTVTQFAQMSPAFSAAQLPSENAVEILGDILLLLTGFIVGVLFVIPPQALSARNRLRMLGAALPLAHGPLMISVATVAILCMVFGRGPANIWRSAEYIPVQSAALTVVANIVSWPAAFGLGAVAARYKDALRPTSIAFFCGIWLVALAEASRTMAVFPLLFSMGAILANPAKRKPKILFIAALLSAPFLQAAAIEFRALPFKGIAGVPNLANHMLDTELLPALEKDLGNIVMGVRITFQTKYASRSDLSSYIVFALNPLPSLASDSSLLDVYAQERVNIYEPFNAIGELLSANLVLAIFYYFVVGMIFGYVERRLRRGNISVGPVLQTCLCLAFSALSLQYSLRTVNRLLYYSLLIGLIGALIDRQMKKHANNRPATVRLSVEIA